MAETRKATIYYGGFAFRGGGAFMHAKVMKVELQRAGWDVELITLESLPQLVRYLPHVVGRVVNRLNPPMGYYCKDRLTRALYRRFFNRDVQLRIFEDLYLAWNSEIPSVTAVHSVWSDNLHSIVADDAGVKRLVQAEERAIDSIAHPMFTVSHAYRDFLVDTHGGSSRLGAMSVVTNGLDLAEFDVAGEPNHADESLVYCGSLESRKNVQFLLGVFRTLHMSDPAYRLTIIGDGPAWKGLELYALQHELPVVLRGRLDRKDVIHELRQHSVYVHPSVMESFSFSLLEAKLAGLTTVAYERLEVPAEFIDVPVASFEENAWLAAIKQAGVSPLHGFDATAYSSRRMMHETLELAFGPGGGGS